MSTLRTSRAILALDDLGLSHEAAPLRRSLIEHALGLVWLSEAEDSAVDSIISAYQGKTLETIKKALADGSEQELLSLANQYIPVEIGSTGENTYLHFKHLCERFKVQHIYLAWLRNTNLSHASFSSALAYIDITTESPTLLRQSNLSDPADSLNSLKEIASLLLLASHAYNEILKEKPWAEQVARFERELSEAVGFTEGGNSASSTAAQPDDAQ